MKVYPFKIQKESQQSILVQYDEGIRFYDRLHQHQDMQLSFIVKGQGTYIIGDALGEFKPGNFFLIGANLPHIFKMTPQNLTPVKMISIFFTEKSLGRGFFNLPELWQIKKMLNDSYLGLKVTHNTALENTFLRIKKKASIANILVFLEVLKSFYLANCTLLASVNAKTILSETEGKRMDKVYQFVLEKFKSKISLEQMSDIAAMSKPAFCRYFKQHTNKTFVTFLNELRIGEASRQLQQTTASIQSIAYSCGFNNLTNFNRTFKLIKKLSPSEYRKKIRKN